MNDKRQRSRYRWVKWVVIGVVGVVALGAGVIAWYVLTNDAPDPLDAQDLENALTDTTAVGATTGGTTGGTTPATTAAEGGSVATDGVDGTWSATGDSVVRYRVDEVLFDANATAVGETNAVTGTLTIAGTSVTDGSFEVDMTTVKSDKSQRDGQFRGRIMSVDEFPTATFTLTQPIDFRSVPAEGEQITASATGDLTLRGVTNTVTFDVTAQREGDRIGVLGSIPITFADYDIPNPSFGGISTEDHGDLEFVLVFERG